MRFDGDPADKAEAVEVFESRAVSHLQEEAQLIVNRIDEIAADIMIGEITQDIDLLFIQHPELKLLGARLDAIAAFIYYNDPEAIQPSTADNSIGNQPYAAEAS